MEMRKSNVLARLREGKTALCVKTNLADSRAVEIAALAGFDCIWTCAEHVPNDLSVIEKQILAAKAYQTDIIVRVSRGGYSDYIRPLELDATGIMVPHIMSAADARNVVHMTRFSPVGLRPVDGGNADGMFCALGFNDYIRQANEQRMLIVQIEDKEAVDELEEICSTPGIDMIFFGPADFSQSAGIPGQIHHEKVEKVRRLVPEMAHKYGKFAGTVGDPSSLGELLAMGYQFVNVGADVVALTEYYRKIYNAVCKYR